MSVSRNRPPDRLILENRAVKYSDTRAALDHYEILIEPDEHGEIRGLPEDARPVHALLRPPQEPFQRPDLWSPGTHLITFLDSWQRAACGQPAKVVLPMAFDDADPDSCERCRKQTARWADDASGWWANRASRDAERSRREKEHEDAKVRHALRDNRRNADEEQNRV
jgi:hypothetical protein